MAGELDNLFSAVNQTLSIAGTEETVRSIVSSPLATGVRPNIGTSFLPRTQTLRISSGADPSTTGANQNDRAQTPPGAMNKVPRLYGNVTTGGVIIDAVKSDANTIFVAMVLSEHQGNSTVGFDWNDAYPGGSPDASWELHDVYYDNFRCEVSGGVAASQFGRVNTLVPLDGSTNVDIQAANVLHTYAWAGNSSAGAMIFPVDGYAGSASARNAYDIFPTWNATDNPMTDLVFVIVEVDRLNEDIDPTANIEIDEIGEWRFTIETKGLVRSTGNVSQPNDTRLLSNPSGAMQDYLTNGRYGVGLSIDDLDRDSFNAWYDYCDETYYYGWTESGLLPSPVGNGTYDGDTYYVYIDDRWKIGGFINPQVPVAENIDEIGKAGQGTLAYDNRTGKFRVLVNRPMTTAEKANAFLFNSDNIVSGIQVNSTDLYSLFNFADASFPNNLQQDQPDTAIVETPTADRLNNEPTSGMSFQLTSVNTRYHAAQMANNSLKSSRVGNMCRFDADYSTLDVQVGDFVKVTDDSKGWDEKFWRVMRATEIEGDSGEIVMQFSCVEYDQFVFEDIIYVNDRDRGFATGVSTREAFFQLDEFTFDDIYESQSPVLVHDEFQAGIPNNVGWDIIIVDNPLSGNGNIYYANGVFKSQETIADLSFTIDPNDDRPVSLGIIDTDNEPWAAVATVIDVPSSNANIQTNWDTVTISLVGQDGNEGTQAFTQSDDTYDHPPSGDTGWTSIALNKVSSGTYKIAVQYNQNDSVPSRSSGISTTPNVTITQHRCDGNALLSTYGPGTQINQTVTMSNVTAQTVNMHTPVQHDVCNIKQGEFTITTNFTPTWTSITAGVDDVAFTPTGNILFVNDANIASHVVQFGGGGIDYDGIGSNDAARLLNNVQTVTNTFSSDPAYHGLDSSWYPSRINVVMVGRNTATGGDFTDVSYSITNQDRYYRNA